MKALIIKDGQTDLILKMPENDSMLDPRPAIKQCEKLNVTPPYVVVLKNVEVSYIWLIYKDHCCKSLSGKIEIKFPEQPKLQGDLSGLKI